MDIEEILSCYKDLCEDNDWNVFHTPKNLSAALCVNSAKILEHFQWVTEEESFALGRIPDRKDQITEEIAEAFFHLLSLSNKLGVDLESAILAKAKRDSDLHQGVPDDMLET